MPVTRPAAPSIVILIAALSAAGVGCAPTGDTVIPDRSTTWQQRSAIYELFVRDFSPTGDFRGVITGLDRVAATGANVIWLMPIHPVGVENRKGTLGSSYSVRDYRGVNPEYGTIADFRALVEAVHARDMKLIIDWVPNHTAWDNPWLTAHPEWYTRNSAGEITEPLNDDGTSTTWTDVADLNYASASMRREMISAMRYWLEEMDIDGFRVDMAGMVPSDFWREAVPELRAAGADLLLAEWADPEMYDLGFDLTYPWETYHGLKRVWNGEMSATDWVAHEVNEQAVIPFGGRVRFTTNHDETAWDNPPVVLFAGPAGARAAFAATALLPGTPLLYNGQEVESPQKLGLFERELVDWHRAGADEARAWYRSIVELTRTHPDFDSGAFSAVTTTRPADVVAYMRGGSIVVVNARNSAVDIGVTGLDIDGARDLLSNRLQRGATLSLAPYGVAVLELR